jgi:hypothetical protein
MVRLSAKLTFQHLHAQNLRLRFHRKLVDKPYTNLNIYMGATSGLSGTSPPFFVYASKCAGFPLQSLARLK